MIGPSPVFIAGVGIISAIGNNTSECLDSLRQGRAGIGDMKYLTSEHQGKIPVAEVKLTNGELSKRSGLGSQISRTAMLSMIAAKEAFSFIGNAALSNLRIGFISANTLGGMDKTEQFFSQFLKDDTSGKLRGVINHECGAITELVADQLGITGYLTTVSTACSSSANAISLGARLIKHGILDVALAGGTDALARFTLNGFHSLMILDSDQCRPFDEDRKGLNLGEGAGYLLLVSPAVAEKMEDQLFCKLAGYANANDAYHQTASSPEGTGSFLAMQSALQQSNLHASDIDYINLHGTGTLNNDLAEGKAIERLFGPVYPKMSSTKSFTGHSLGASGGMEAVFSVMSIKMGLIYPNLRLTHPMNELSFVPERTFSIDPGIKHVLSNSFGFGGNCTSLIFSKL